MPNSAYAKAREAIKVQKEQLYSEPNKPVNQTPELLEKTEPHQARASSS